MRRTVKQLRAELDAVEADSRANDTMAKLRQAEAAGQATPVMRALMLDSAMADINHALTLRGMRPVLPAPRGIPRPGRNGGNRPAGVEVWHAAGS